MPLHQNPDFKRFLKTFALVVLTLIVLDFLFGSLLKHYYFKLKYGMFYRTTYAIDSTKADLLVFGSSKATHNYVPSVFADKLHTTFYDCGRDGTCLIYYTAVMSAALERYTPKHIIIDLTPYELCGNEEGLLSPLLPYQHNPAIAPYLKYNGKFQSVKLLSKMYAYNSMLVPMIIDNSGHDRQHHSDDRGYLRLDNIMPYHPLKLFQPDRITPERVQVLNRIFSKLNQKHVDVTAVLSPTYFTYLNHNTNAAIIENLCREHHIRFLNYENSAAYVHHELYNDDTHLNHTGALKFSMEVSDSIANK